MKNNTTLKDMNVHIKDIPEEVVENFKIWCWKHKTTMKDAITEFMKEKGNEIEVTIKKK